MRLGADYFVAPSDPAQRRYEALCAYFVEERAAHEVAEQFGYSKASVHQMASELRGRRATFFRDSKPGPKGPRKSGRIRDEVLALRAEDFSVEQIAAAIAAAGTPVSAQTVWTILAAEGLERLPRRPAGERGVPARLDPVKVRALPTRSLQPHTTGPPTAGHPGGDNARPKQPNMRRSSGHQAETDTTGADLPPSEQPPRPDPPSEISRKVGRNPLDFHPSSRASVCAPLARTLARPGNRQCGVLGRSWFRSARRS
jgi:hypothetical protein